MNMDEEVRQGLIRWGLMGCATLSSKVKTEDNKVQTYTNPNSPIKSEKPSFDKTS